MALAALGVLAAGQQLGAVTLSGSGTMEMAQARAILQAGQVSKLGDGTYSVQFDSTEEAQPLAISVMGGTLRLEQKKHRARAFGEIEVAKGCLFEQAAQWASAVSMTGALRGEGEIRVLAHRSGNRTRELSVNGACADFKGKLSASAVMLSLTPEGGVFGGSLSLTVPNAKYDGTLRVASLDGVTVKGDLTLGGGTRLEVPAGTLRVGGTFVAEGPVTVRVPTSAISGDPVVELLSGAANTQTAANLQVDGFRVVPDGERYVLADAAALPAVEKPAQVTLAVEKPAVAAKSVEKPAAPKRTGNTFTLLTWNVYQQGTQQKGGYEMIISELVRLKPDLVVLVEVRNYGKKDWLARVAADLKARGETYYTHWSEGAGVLSRTPFEDTLIWPGPRGNVRKAVTEIDGHAVALYAGHLDASYCAYYKAYPYAGKKLSEAERQEAVTKILQNNVTSDRDNMAYAFLNDARQEIAAGRWVIFCGDFNETSHLDWTEATKNLRSHNGFVIPWTVSMALAGDGFIDAYRQLYPNPVTHPCTTYPSAMDNVDPKRIAWDKTADERERIDFIHYKGKGLKVKDIRIYGPRDSVGYGKIIRETGSDPFLEPVGPWPSDHKGLWATFAY